MSKLNPIVDAPAVAQRLKGFVLKAEKTGQSGKSKQTMVVDWLSELVDIPWVPRTLERMLWRLVVNIAVDVLKDSLALLDAPAKPEK